MLPVLRWVPNLIWTLGISQAIRAITYCSNAFAVKLSGKYFLSCQHSNLDKITCQETILDHYQFGISSCPNNISNHCWHPQFGKSNCEENISDHVDIYSPLNRHKWLWCRHGEIKYLVIWSCRMALYKLRSEHRIYFNIDHHQSI